MLPYFYHPSLTDSDTTVTVAEDTSKHIVQVLRMQVDEQIKLTNGNGLIAVAKIIAPHKKHCVVSIEHKAQQLPPSKQNTIAVALLKNVHRFEWFLEKATELGIAQIVPLITKRTEKQNFKQERMQQIVVSAMLQSQQAFLPLLASPEKFETYVKTKHLQNKLIAHCIDVEKSVLQEKLTVQNILLIGPEGDFTPEEIEMALTCGYQPVSLGNTRLRTETAAVVGATVLQLY